MDDVKDDRSDFAAEPLLGEDDSDLKEKAWKSSSASLWSSRLTQLRWILLIHGVIIITYLFLLSVVIIPHFNRHDGKAKEEKSHLPLPSRQGLQWEERRFTTNIVDNPFTGPPREEMETAWHDMLKNDNIRVPVGYLEEKNLHSVYTKDHSEGIASLSVYHSLHCLKKVKRMMFKEHYYADKDEVAMAREEKHADHCVEYIREALMCQPDLSLVTFRWINDTAQHEDPTEFYPTNFDVDMHYCANWEHLDRWAGERAFDLFQVELLDRPE